MKSTNDKPMENDVLALPPTEQFFLWAIRAWSAYHDDLAPVWPKLDNAFSQQRVRGALQPFHQLMSALFTGQIHWPDIRCPVCPRLGTDEARLLDAFSRVQNDDVPGARYALSGWLQRATARAVCEKAADCVLVAATAGLRFAVPLTESGAFQGNSDTSVEEAAFAYGLGRLLQSRASIQTIGRHAVLANTSIVRTVLRDASPSSRSTL